MNDADKRELANLKQRQQALDHLVQKLAEDIQRVEMRMALDALKASEAGSQSSQTTPTPAIAPLPVAKSSLPDIPPVIEPEPEFVAAKTDFVAPEPEIASQPAEFVPSFVFQDAQKVTPVPAKTPAVPPPLPPSLPPPRVVSEPKSPEPKASFEMRLGTYWLVRIGAVLILTGLVFFGNLAYQNMGAAGKVSLLYLAGGLLLGAGAWWQRKAASESLRNYAQVLFSGGLAAVYFTTYAAHHLPALQVIASPLVDGALLLGWAAFIAWIAHRWKSELMALFGTGLAYYTSVITPVGGFTLYSNLVLTLAAVFFLVRNRWAGLSWASLVATYASYGYWRFYQGGEGWHWATADQGLAFGASFLFGYWIIFTVAVFLSKHENIAGGRRAAFATFNNGALFTLFVLTMLKVDTHRFWQFAICFGAALLVLAEVARRFLKDESVTKNTYLTQGLVLVTVGIVSKYAGMQLALVLAAESVILFILGTLRKNIFLQTGAYISGAMSVGWGIDSLHRDDVHGLWLGVALGALMALNACWSHWRMLWADKRELRPVPAYFTLLALLMWAVTTWFNTSVGNFPLALAVEAVVLTATIYFLRVREITVLGQGLLMLAHLAWLGNFADAQNPPPWWNPLTLLALTLALSHWWQRQKAIELRAAAGVVFQFIYAAMLVALTLVWLGPKNLPGEWIALTSALAVGVTVYGVATRAWPLAACAQMFLFVSCGQFALRVSSSVKPEWYFPLAPVAALAGLSFATWKWFAARPESDPKVRGPLLQLAMLYRWVSLVLTLWWVNRYIPERERVWVLALMGVCAFVFAGWRRNREALLFSTALTVTALATLWLFSQWATLVYLPNFLAVLALLAQQQAARKLIGRYELPPNVQGVMIATGCVTLWWLVSQWVLMSASGFYLTAAWSGLAFVVIGCGVVLREKVYRWMGLGILAASVGRVVIFDVWKLETKYRMLSFLMLGFVLVALGFIYNKYQDKIRQWL